MGGGTLTGQGTVSVKDLRPDTVALSLTGRNLTMAVPGLYTGGVDGSLSLSGPALRRRRWPATVTCRTAPSR